MNHKSLLSWAFLVLWVLLSFDFSFLAVRDRRVLGYDLPPFNSWSIIWISILLHLLASSIGGSTWRTLYYSKIVCYSSLNSMECRGRLMSYLGGLTWLIKNGRFSNDFSELCLSCYCPSSSYSEDFSYSELYRLLLTILLSVVLVKTISLLLILLIHYINFSWTLCLLAILCLTWNLCKSSK